MAKKTTLLKIGELLEIGERPEPQGRFRLKEPPQRQAVTAAQKLEESRLLEELPALCIHVARVIPLRNFAGQRRTDKCLLCKHGPVPRRNQEPCRHSEFFAFADSTASVDLGRLKDLIVWLAPWIERRNANGMPSDKFCLLCTLGIRQQLQVHMLGPRPSCPHTRVWEIAGLRPQWPSPEPT